MKINPTYASENAESSKKNDKPNWQSERRRRAVTGEGDAAVKYRLSEPAIKEETKFVNILESAAKPQKPAQTGKDSDSDRHDDDRKDRNRAAGEKDTGEVAADHQRIERHEAFSGGQFGTGTNLGGGSEAGHAVNLSENFAARSILHIADLERMISVIRSQTSLGGKREIYLELKRSVMDGLRVRITTDPAAQVQIEFLAADEKVRSQIDGHAEELADILCGRGIKLLSLRTSIDSYSKVPNDSAEESNDISANPMEGNTFEA